MSKHFMFLIKYAEIAIKGKNRHLFEDALCKLIRHAVKNYGITGRVEKQPGRIYLETEDSETYDDDRVCEALQHVFGITAICPVKQMPVMDFEELTAEVVKYVEET
ncbi:MAG: tRNA 4-thiouridine(8) synthase ThiI, partial [Lachnospiraceae bacterium]|nr:tRNA 4-thiouridine(8) synthase ThiI [Lachnospiraceae bacterium]